VSERDETDRLTPADAEAGYKLRESLRQAGEAVSADSWDEVFRDDHPPALYMEMLELTPTFPGLNGAVPDEADLREVVAEAANEMAEAVLAEPDEADAVDSDLARRLGAPDRRTDAAPPDGST
jgi:hypothetical protein